ncbi:MAG: cytosine permease [Frankiaceae bacterium]|nr:cytosine permease [Frankiaceae bacterium]MBV9869016.1 cytosine permease [Frankiaceae bacterium]
MTTVQDDPHIAATTEIREGEYGEKVAAVEPGGAEFIPLDERHGKPLNLFWTWMSPNFEFATVFVGVLCVIAFGLTFTQSVAAIVLGTVLGSVTHGALSARGPEYGVPQMILSRISFGYWGNALPAGINAVIAGIGWFAVNSVSGALALNTLWGLNKLGCLLIIVAAQIAIALYGHNLVHVFERVAFPLLVVSFGLGAIWTFKDAHLGAAPPSHGGIGGFLIAVGATFGYACGWNPYASDYTRYMAPDTDKKAVAWWSGFGVALSCIALEILGAASATSTGLAGFDGPGPFVGGYPRLVRDLVLLSIAVGAVAANVLNIYSGAMSFTTLGIRIPLKFRRALIAGVFGVAGFFVAWNGLDNIKKYEDFLLVIAYWIGPWLAVVFVDQWLRRGNQADKLYDHKYENLAGPIAMAVGMAVSISLFSDQSKYVAWVPKHHPKVGDLTFEVGFVVAAVVYYVLYKAIGNKRPGVVELPN